MHIDPLPRLQQIGYHRRLLKETRPEERRLIRQARKAPWNYTEEVVARAVGLQRSTVGEITRGGRKS